MKATRIIAIALAAATLPLFGGCLAVVRAPIRAEREERAEAAFRRLAAFAPESIARFLDDRMIVALALTPGQRAAVREINLRAARRIHEIAAAEDSPREKVSRLRSLDEAKSRELRPVLTTDQMARYEAMKEQLRESLRTWAEEAR